MFKESFIYNNEKYVLKNCSGYFGYYSQNDYFLIFNSKKIISNDDVNFEFDSENIVINGKISKIKGIEDDRVYLLDSHGGWINENKVEKIISNKFYFLNLLQRIKYKTFIYNFSSLNNYNFDVLTLKHGDIKFNSLKSEKLTPTKSLPLQIFDNCYSNIKRVDNIKVKLKTSEELIKSTLFNSLPSDVCNNILKYYQILAKANKLNTEFNPTIVSNLIGTAYDNAGKVNSFYPLPIEIEKDKIVPINLHLSMFKLCDSHESNTDQLEKK